MVSSANDEDLEVLLAADIYAGSGNKKITSFCLEMFRRIMFPFKSANNCTDCYKLRCCNSQQCYRDQYFRPCVYHIAAQLRVAPFANPSQALRGAAAAALRPSATAASLQPRISHHLLQTRLLSQEVRSAIDKAVASAPVVLFMKGTPETPQCGFSRTSIQILGMQGVDPAKFTAFNVLEDEELRSGMWINH